MIAKENYECRRRMKIQDMKIYTKQSVILRAKQEEQMKTKQ